jgi:LytS/YehU family sensor histidine kinase
MFVKKNIFIVGLHLAVWMLFIFLNYMLIRDTGLKYDIYKLSVIVVYIVVFYTFYLFITPLLLKKRTLIFVFTSVILIAGAIYSNYTIHEKINIEIQRKRIEFGIVPEDIKGGINSNLDRPPFEKKNFKLLWSTFQILFFVLVSLLLRFVQKWHHDEKTRYILEKEKSDAELLFLKQQINPHFLFNSLNSIYSLANKKSDITTEAILKLSAILRYILYHSDKSQVPLADELTTLSNYIELQYLRITDKVKLKYKVEGNIETYFIEPFLLMPLFENAFKYGIDSISESFIDILINISDGRLTLKISNKIVPQNNKLDEESGIGLQNIKRRLELLYPDNYILDIIKQQQVFTVCLRLKLKKNEMSGD